jgi:hypothetical protein
MTEVVSRSYLAAQTDCLLRETLEKVADMPDGLYLHVAKEENPLTTALFRNP